MKGAVHARGTGAGRQGEHRLAQGRRLFHRRYGRRRQSGIGRSAPDYWLDYKDAILTLNFTLPFKQPVKAKDLKVEIYDRSYFVAVEFAKGMPVKLVGAPCECKGTIEWPRELSFAEGKNAERQSGGGRQLGRELRQQNRGAMPVMRPRSLIGDDRRAVRPARAHRAGVGATIRAAFLRQRPRRAASPAGFWPSRQNSISCCRT